MQEKPQRLDKFLTSQNIGSRREAIKLIKSGKVKIDGEISVKPDAKIMPGFTAVKVDGKFVDYQKYLYVMMNKPKGLICATEDRHMQTVLDILPEQWRRKGMFPAGRLDKDTTGLLIITDDGDFAHQMLSPKKHVYKLYKAVTERRITDNDIKKFELGIKETNTEFAPAELWEEKVGERSYAFVKIREGKFHQVKRMFEVTGNAVIELERVQIGELPLDTSLDYGECKIMTKEEKDKIFK
ncbi:pseudouridine synthase [Scatolibacter rhodanostii]|uniref:pseudouridine synthase n=1 Tax=Scatolibacter rhodanostii TaxID=2014781 RepID=UPI000C07E7D1|nr:pseudouridine synthase [Scatolibacter rhodanostii]